ncbi:SHOCT domain-containing protein [Arcicella aquatica]|uniref:SHOCT domain-containing protein n=1 Tax=Arcicella aquatica TaxID=217141 RepID=A0ABU5QSZ1_9BACT|nr:SHOCT domain-containing protein [Arcicella aquatica]MEA5260217.1 SHOCT domain-containing protein [Arcicella aquatica]
MFYNDSYWGMHFLWWFIWVGLLFWLFVTPYEVPGQRTKRNSAHHILQKRYAAGEITLEEYKEMRKILDNDAPKIY